MAVDVKKVLLNLGEENAKILIKDVLRPLAQDYIQNSPSKIDDIVLPFLDMIEKAMLEAVDKIDNEVG
jgi:hypothetical protein